MDYEKKYNEALERAKRLRDSKYQTMNAKRVVEEIFPVLAESEDEKIRKELIGHCKDLVRMNKDDIMLSIYEPWLAWLESLRPSWKPSEEQMDRLFSIETALREDYCYHMADFLANLYADLKKLI